jgi:hypothetical protein
VVVQRHHDISRLGALAGGNGRRRLQPVSTQTGGRVPAAATAGIDQGCVKTPFGVDELVEGGGSLPVRVHPQLWMASISGRTPMIAMTRLIL